MLQFQSVCVSVDCYAMKFVTSCLSWMIRQSGLEVGGTRAHNESCTQTSFCNSTIGVKGRSSRSFKVVLCIMLELEVKEQDQSYLNLVYFPIKAYTSPWLHSLRKGSVHAWLMLFTHSGVACVFDLKAGGVCRQ